MKMKKTFRGNIKTVYTSEQDSVEVFIPKNIKMKELEYVYRIFQNTGVEVLAIGISEKPAKAKLSFEIDPLEVFECSESETMIVQVIKDVSIEEEK